MSFKNLVLSIELSAEEQQHFVRICSNWALYCESLANFDKLTVLKLLKYLLEERSKSKYLLIRCIGKFNRLNALQREMLE